MFEVWGIWVCFVYFLLGSIGYHFLPTPSVFMVIFTLYSNYSKYIKCTEINLCSQNTCYSTTDSIWNFTFLEKWNFIFYCNSASRAPGGVVGSQYTAALTSAFLSFAAAHMVDYYHFMVTVISNLVESDS